MKRRVVVTGMGAITPLGCDFEMMWKNLIAHKSGIRLNDRFDTFDISVKIAAALHRDGEMAFEPDLYMTSLEQRRVDSFIIYAVAAAKQAADLALFDELSEEQRKRAIVYVGSGIGGLNQMYNTSVELKANGVKGVGPFFIPSMLINLAAGHISIKHKFFGESSSVVSACATGSHNIGGAFKMIRDGYADYALAGGTEHAVLKLTIAGFAASKALTKKFNDEPEKASRPWDKRRSGFVVGEGAGILALEEMESAQKRGAHIYGEIVGFGTSCDAFHITAPLMDGSMAALAMQNALDFASITADKIDYINAHGTSTVAGDLAEIIAIKKVFGDGTEVNISSTKSSMGHLLGAAGSIESMICLLAMRDGIVPATLNLDEPDDGCDLNLTAKVPQKREISYAMNNSFGFGGTNACLIFKKNCID